MQPSADAFIVDAKLRTPMLRADHLRRAGLVQMVCAAGGPLVVVRAGAGYGKTTTVRQWVEEDDRHVAWVTLDEGDNDPVVLLRHVVRALGGLQSLDEVESLLALEPPPIPGAVLPHLASALALAQQPSILVLDDAHVLTSASSGELLAWLVTSIPDGWTLALVGRDMPEMPLSRLVVNHEALVLRRADLAFSAAESVAVVARALPDATREEALELHRATEGWPAGLYLSLLALKNAPERAAVMAGLATTAHGLDAYFHEELLRSLDPSTRLFLLRTSVLARLSGPLCDVVAEREGSDQILRRMAESDNLFLGALDDTTDAYRYHHLFADLLLAELRRVAPGEEAPLRRRAAVWLSDHDETDAAFHQALLAGDRQLAAEIAYRPLDKYVSTGQVETVLRWRAAFTEDEVRRSPHLAILSGWVDLLSGKGGDVDHWIELATSLGVPRGGSDPAGDLGLAVATLAMVRGEGGVKTTQGHARVVIDAGEGATAWWPVAVLLDAQASYLVDRDADMVQLCRDAEFATRGSPSAHAVAQAHLALAHFLVGDERRGQRAIAAAVTELKHNRLEHFTLTVLVHAVHSLGAARRHEFAESAGASEAALDLLDIIGVVARTQCLARICLADAALHRGEPALAERLVREAGSLLDAEPDAVFLWDGVDRLHAELADLRRQQRVVGGVGLTEAELRVLRLLPTYRSLEEIGEALFVSRNTVKTHSVSIYRKLGVSGRSAAVERARSLGMVDDDMVT